MKFITIIATFLLLPIISFAQSDFDKALKAGEVLLSGFSIIKSTTGTKKESKTISSVCIKNKLTEKITFKLTSLADLENKVEKQMIVQNDGKECVFDIPKGVYAYEIILCNNEIYKKGEYKFEEDVTITIKKDE